MLLRFADLMEKHATELALLETLDMGKPIGDSSSVDVPLSIQCIRWYAEAIDKIYDEIAPTAPNAISLIRREPLGVVGAVIPWNFPLLMGSWKIGPALATGNSMVVKPAEQSPLSMLRLAELAAEAGVPEGVFNVVPGYGETAGQALGRHMDVDAITFTGSTEVGKYFLRYSGESNMKQVSLECGGKTPNIIMADAPNLDAAAEAAAWGIFFNQGEVCNAGSRLIVEESVKDAVLEKIQKVAQILQPGDPLDPKTKMGAMVDETQMNRVLGYIEAGSKEGAKLAFGGKRVRSETRRLLHRADGVRRREEQHEDRAGRDLRPGAVDHHLQGPGGSGEARQRHDLRPRRRGVDQRHQQGVQDLGCPARRRGMGQLLRQRPHLLAVRRLQAVRLRPRQVAARDGQIHAAEGDLDQHQLMPIDRQAERARRSAPLFI